MGHHGDSRVSPLYAQTAHVGVGGGVGGGSLYRLAGGQDMTGHLRHDILAEALNSNATAADLGPLHGLTESPHHNPPSAAASVGSVSPQHQDTADSLVRGAAASSDAPVWRPY